SARCLRAGSFFTRATPPARRVALVSKPTRAARGRASGFMGLVFQYAPHTATRKMGHRARRPRTTLRAVARTHRQTPSRAHVQRSGWYATHDPEERHDQRRASNQLATARSAILGRKGMCARWHASAWTRSRHTRGGAGSPRASSTLPRACSTSRMSLAILQAWAGGETAVLVWGKIWGTTWETNDSMKRHQRYHATTSPSQGLMRS